MKSWKIPTRREVDEAVALLAHGEHHRYFFDKLENPEWLGPLKEKGFFSSPPAPIHDKSKGTIAFPPWPESRYLARMAGLKPTTVAEILVQIPPTDNIRVHDDLADAALAMPANISAKVVAGAVKWVKSPYQMLLPQKLGALVSHLTRGGETGPALDIGKALLEVRADSRATQKDIEANPLLFPEAQPYFDLWNYQHVVQKNIPDLVEVAGEPALTLLCDVLESAVKLSRRGDEVGEPEDHSYIWRPSLDRGQSEDREARNVLVSAVRDAAERICKHDPSAVKNVVATLEGRSWNVFHRLGLHVLRLFPDAAPSLVSERLGDPGRFDQPAFRREYNLLAKERFGQLDTELRGRILEWIERGLDTDFVRTRLTEFAGRPVTVDEALTYVKQWQRDRLAPIAANLPEEWKKRYEQLVVELGPGRDPGRIRSVVGGTIAPRGPKDAKELSAMSVDQLVGYLQQWVPTPEPMGESREGLGVQVGTLVSTEPERYSTEFERFIGLDPTYVRAALQALWVPAREKRSIAWASILRLCSWVSSQEREMPGRRGGIFDQDPDWGWTRDAIANLLSEGLGHGDIPFALREEVWKVLGRLTEDKMPTPDDDAQYGANLDPASHSINTTRGKAMKAAVQYAVWVRRHLEQEQGEKSVAARGFDEMPEVRAVLDKHLDSRYEQSRAVLVVYGQWFATLHWLDRNWTKAKKNIVFPEGETSKAVWNVTWGAYIIFCQPYNELFDALSDEYRRAITRIGESTEDWRHLGSPDSRLAEHLMTEYWWGHIDWKNPEGLLREFYEKADPKLRGWAIEFVGRSLHATSTEISPDVLERLKNLWSRRLEAVHTAGKDSPEVEELKFFAWWFASKKFDDEWAMVQLREALLAAGTVAYDQMVVERLAETAAKLPAIAVECLTMIVESDKDGWAILGWRDRAREILSAAMGSGDPTAQDAAVRLVHYLGRRGYFEFKDLLPLASTG